MIGGEPPEVEVQCHGGPAAMALVVAALIAGGAEMRPALGLGRAIRRPSRLAAEAALDLARAPTLRTAEILLDQAKGRSIASFEASCIA